MTYQEQCDWFSAFGDAGLEAAESDFNSYYDDRRERYSALPDDPYDLGDHSPWSPPSPVVELTSNEIPF